MKMELDVRDFLRNIENKIVSRRRITQTFLNRLLYREIDRVSRYKALALAELESLRWPKIEKVENYLVKLRELETKLQAPDQLSAQVGTAEERDINRMLLRILNRTTRN